MDLAACGSCVNPTRPKTFHNKLNMPRQREGRVGHAERFQWNEEKPALVRRGRSQGLLTDSLRFNSKAFVGPGLDIAPEEIDCLTSAMSRL